MVGVAILLLSVLVSCVDDKEKKTVVCWGDSLTASHTNVGGNGIKQFLKETFMGDDSYPGVLQDLLEDGYDVVNYGVGGENTLTIMARQSCLNLRPSFGRILTRNLNLSLIIS